MKFKIYLTLLILILINVTMVDCGFMEKLRGIYKKSIFSDVSKGNKQNDQNKIDGGANEDRILQIVGDGSILMRVKINKSDDGGITFFTVTDFMTLVSVCPCSKFKTKLNSFHPGTSHTSFPYLILIMVIYKLEFFI